MVELPRYVRRVVRKRQSFYYYARHRGTAQAWPSIPLPDPFDRRFASRLAVCDALSLVDGSFRLGAVALPDPREEGFWEVAEAAKRLADAEGNAARKNFKALIAAFKLSDAYAALAPSTRRGYDAYARTIETVWGDDLPAELTTVDAQEAIDSMADTPAAANQFRAFLSRLMAFGVPRGYCLLNTVEPTEKMRGSQPWPSWPDWAFKLFFEHAPPKLAMPVVSALFTGQREVDILAMPRPRVVDGTIPVRAQKTGEIVWIPIHSEYRRWIEMVPKADAVQLHLGARGAAYTANGFRAEWRKLMNKEDGEGRKVFVRFREERIVFHGLRKNAVIMLLEAGCTESQVGAIVNMSEQMVRHYSRDVRVRALARDGMKLLENRWAELRPASLPRTGTERELETGG